MGKKIHVVFVDASTGEAIAESFLPPDILPETFEVETNLNLEGKDWRVVNAEPKTASEFRRTGKLVVTLERLMAIPAKDILFTLPTICDRLPAADDRGTKARDIFEIHEDSWRQVELVSMIWGDEIEAEFEEIAAIFREQSVDVGVLRGFRKLHIRKRIERPIAGDLNREELLSSFSPEACSFGGACFEGTDRPIRGGFAFRFDDSVVYGHEEHRSIQVVGLHWTSPPARELKRFSTSLARIMESRDLLLVDWCCVRQVLGDAGAILDYLKSLSG